MPNVLLAKSSFMSRTISSLYGVFETGTSSVFDGSAFRFARHAETYQRWSPSIRTWCDQMLCVPLLRRCCASSRETVGSRSKNLLEGVYGYTAKTSLGAHFEAPGQSWGSRASAAPECRKPGQSAHAESTQGSFPDADLLTSRSVIISNQFCGNSLIPFPIHNYFDQISFTDTDTCPPSGICLKKLEICNPSEFISETSPNADTDLKWSRINQMNMQYFWQVYSAGLSIVQRFCQFPAKVGKCR